VATYVYLPGHLIISLPAYLMTNTLFGWYDQRLIYIIALAGLMAVAWWALKQSPVREPLVALFALSPFAIILYYYGTNEIVMIALLALAAVLTARRRFWLAAAALGLALADKQLSWIIGLPLLVAIWRLAPDLRNRLVVAWLTFGIPFISILPFLIWGPIDLLQDTLGFFSRDVTYPAGGEGVGGLLVSAGVIAPDQPFPFWLLELLFAVPILTIIARWVWNDRRPHRLLLAGTLAFVTISFFWRYFLPAHVEAAVMMIGLTFLVREVEQRVNVRRSA
ncbi:MAG: DUF2029 domain-containing protein, partial [Candidatus Kerfeldbacteria bacterium]|nr:DUF2029 domain-containing protein [Candidatus Kerfeldbacteria bacterium]